MALKFDSGAVEMVAMEEIDMAENMEASMAVGVLTHNPTGQDGADLTKHHRSHSGRARYVLAERALIVGVVVAGVAGGGAAGAAAPAPGVLAVIAGRVNVCAAITPGPAVNSALCGAEGLSVDSAGDVFVADAFNGAIDKINASGTISTFAGGGATNPASCTSGSPCVPTQVGLFNPSDAAVDQSGNVYIADSSNNLVEKVTPGGSLSVFAGSGGTSVSGCTAGSPCTATQVSLGGANAVVTDASGDVYIAAANNYVLKVTPGGSLWVVAGNGTAGAPTTGPATSSDLNGPDGLALDGAGNLYIADYSNNAVEKVTPAGHLSVFAGGGATSPNACTSSSPCAASQVTLTGPNAVATDASGDVDIVTQSNFAVGVTPAGSLTRIAGNGSAAYATPGPATSSQLTTPSGITVDSAGNIYISDHFIMIDEIGGNPIAPVFTAATPPAATDGVAYSYTFAASGVPSPTFAVTSGTVPPGLVLNPSTGVLSGTPTGSGTFSVSATNTAGTATAGPFTLGSSVVAGHDVAAGVGLASTPDGSGYWTVGPTGAITPHGSATSYGSPAGTHLNQPVVGLASTPDGKGYWMVASDGGVFTYGDAGFYGSHGGTHLNQPVVGLASTPDGKGYWMVASDGGVFTYGDAGFYGSGARTGQTAIGLIPSASGNSYQVVNTAGDPVPLVG